MTKTVVHFILRKPVMFERYEPVGSCARVKLHSSDKE